MDGYYTTLGIHANTPTENTPITQTNTSHITGWNLFVKTKGHALSPQLGQEWKDLGKDGQKIWNERAKSM